MQLASISKISTGGATEEFLINGDLALDLTGMAALSGDAKRIIGIILNRTINLAGIPLIFWIKRKERGL